MRTYTITRDHYATTVRTFEDGVQVDWMVNRDRKFDADAHVARLQAFDAEFDDAWTSVSARCNRDLGNGQRCDNVNGVGHRGPCGSGPWR